MDPISSASTAAPPTASGGLAAAAGISVMKKAENLQANAVATLLAGVTQPPQLATSGTLGTRVNTYA